MKTIAIAAADIVGAYIASAIHNKRPDLNITFLYHPEVPMDAFAAAADKMLKSFNADICLTVASKKTPSQYDYFTLLDTRLEVGLPLDLGEEGLNTTFLYRTLLDGFFQRSFVLDMIDEYIGQLPDEIDKVTLTLPGYSYRKEDFVRALCEKNIEVFDPLDEWLMGMPKTKGAGVLRFYWTKRVFEFERRLSEIFQEPVIFRTYYKHPWLRGEGVHKKRATKCRSK